MSRREIRGRRAFVVEGEYALSVPEGVASPPTVLLLHGFGDTLDEFRARLPLDLPGVALLYAGAPIPVEVPRGSSPAGGGAGTPAGGGASPARRIGQTWYAYDGDPDRFRDALDEAEAYLDSLLDEARKKGGVDTGRLLVVGYSMGAYVGGYFALRRAPRPLGVAILAGRVKHEVLETQVAAAAGLPVLLLHGATDARFPHEKFAEGKKLLEAAGARVTDIEHPGGHGLTADHARIVEGWARETLAG